MNVGANLRYYVGENLALKASLKGYAAAPSLDYETSVTGTNPQEESLRLNLSTFALSMGLAYGFGL